MALPSVSTMSYMKTKQAELEILCRGATIARPDLDVLLNAALPFAQKTLVERGHLSPKNDRIAGRTSCGEVVLRRKRHSEDSPAHWEDRMPARPVP